MADDRPIFINPLALHPARYIDPRIEISLQAELHPLENRGVVCRSGYCGSIKGFMLAKSQRIDFGADVGEQHREHHDLGLVDRQGINRSEERRVGKEGVRTCRYRWSRYYIKKKHLKANKR